MDDPGAQPGTLLPEFITRALFEPLNVPEVWFDLPFASDQDASLPIERALREAVPGRVSRRLRVPAPEPPHLASAAAGERGRQSLELATSPLATPGKVPGARRGRTRCR